MAVLEEEEEPSLSREHTAKKGAHSYHPFVISCPWPFGGVVHNLPRVAHIFRWDGLYEAANSWDWTLDTDCELPMVETVRAIHKFSVIVSESPYTRLLSGPPDDHASIHESGSKSGWVDGSSPYLSLNRLLYVSYK